MEALRAEVERQKREKSLKREKEEALFTSKNTDAEKKNDTFSAYASKKELRRREFEEKEDEDDAFEEAREERKRSNEQATNATKNVDGIKSNTNKSKFRSEAARRAFENSNNEKNDDDNEKKSSDENNERNRTEEFNKRIEREVKSLTNQEVIARLRKLNQPAKLFAENEQDRRLRLEVAAKNIKVKESDEHVGGQQANEMLRYNRENSNEAKGNTGAMMKRKLTTKEQEQENKKREAEMAQMEFERAAKRLKKQMDAETDPNAHPIDRVAEHFKRLLKEWAMEIEGTKFDSNAQKRQQVANCELTKTHMKPLFKKMKKRDLPNDIERALFLMFEAMKARDYKRATDAYVGVAIGNAAWPIGVTSVGIHDRSAREKISATTQAHAMHDEETRKYLQSVKRLITFSQRAYPTNPSLAFDWNGRDKTAFENAEKATPGILQRTSNKA